MWAEEGDTMTLQDIDSIDSILPWGWSPLLVQKLRQAGAPESLLPTPEQMTAYRTFASRKTAVKLLSALKKKPIFSYYNLDSSWCTSEAEVRQACKNYGASILKMPWSGSGRGLHPVGNGVLTEKDWAWVRKTLERQGGVEVEPTYNKIQDFAMEFWAESGQVRYEGLSVFETTAGGVYAGNLIASEDVKMARLTHYVPAQRLREVQQEMTILLSTAGIPNWYRGPLGVDMMITENGLHPLIEINLRMTMGWVSIKLLRQLNKGETGTFSITQSNGQYQAIFTKKSV